MRFHFDPRKSQRLRENPQRGIGFEEAQKIFARPYYQDQRFDLPEQYRAIGWVGDKALLAHLRGSGRRTKASFTTWSRFGNLPARKRKNCMPKMLESPKPITADRNCGTGRQRRELARFFTRKGKMMPPIQRVNVDFTVPMLNELDNEARALNISRQAVIKTLLRHALDQQRLARRAR